MDDDFEDLITTEERVEHLLSLIRDFAEERLLDHAVAIMRAFEKEPFIDIDGGYFHWPYAGPKEEMSFAEEMFWVYHHEHIPALIEMGFESIVRSASQRHYQGLSFAEQELLKGTYWPDDARSYTTDETEGFVTRRLVQKVLGFARLRTYKPDCASVLALTLCGTVEVPHERSVLAERGASRTPEALLSQSPFRDVFANYELLFYLTARAGQLGYRVCEIPVRRSYPTSGSTPTKITGIGAKVAIIRQLVSAATGRYHPRDC